MLGELACRAVWGSRVAAILLVSAALPGCGAGADPTPPSPSPQAVDPATGQPAAPPGVSGLPMAATKNTTRIGGADPIARAAAAALAVHPSGSTASRPRAVTLVDQANWAGAISAAQLAGLGAPTLLVDGAGVPAPTSAALALLRPAGSRFLGGAQAVRVGTAVRAPGLSDINVEGADPAALARGIDALRTRAVGEPNRSVIVASLDSPAYAMPAAGWAAKSGDPVLWVRRGEVPPDTVAAIRAREDPRIYVIGPPEAIGEAVVQRLGRLGDVTRIDGPDPVRNAIAFARFRDGDFGWGVVDPGHGMVLATSAQPADAAAGAALSAAGTYGPLLLLDGGEPPAAVRAYLLDIRPGYESDPVRGVYNHAWLMGDATAISVRTQSRIDSLLEIQPVDLTP